MLKACVIFAVLFVIATTAAILAGGCLLELWCVGVLSCLGGMMAQCYILQEKWSEDRGY